MSTTLDSAPTIKALLDLEPLRDLCRHYAELFGIGLRVFDRDGARLVDVRVGAGAGDYSTYLFGFHQARLKLTETVTRIQTLELPAQPTPQRVDCFSGVRYWVAPIGAQGDQLGRLVFGPYRPEELPVAPGALLKLEPTIDRARLAELWLAQRGVPEDAARRIVSFLAEAFELLLHTAGKAYLTNQLHLESVTASYRELEAKNRALSEANERLQDLDRLKSNFVATVSHELRTPLTSVIGYSEMLLEGMAGTLNPEQREYVSTILEKGESLLGLISQVLDLSRVEAGSVRLHYERTAVAALVERAVSDVAPQASKKEIAITRELAADLPPIDVDHDKLRRVLVNILGNAVKFTPKGGTVTVTARAVDEPPTRPGAATAPALDLFEPERNRYLWLTVRDSGLGIPADQLERVFDAFYQVDNSSTRQFEGTGLGLAIARNFVTAHGGTIWAESGNGPGSTFHVALPYVHSPAPLEGYPSAA